MEVIVKPSIADLERLYGSYKERLSILPDGNAIVYSEDEYLNEMFRKKNEECESLKSKLAELKKLAARAIRMLEDLLEEKAIHERHSQDRS